MDLLREIIKIRKSKNHKPDFNHFLSAIKNPESQPVTIGDIFADIATTAHYFKTSYFDFNLFNENPNYQLSVSEFSKALKTIRNMVRFCVENGWNHAFGFSNIPLPGMHKSVNNLANQSIDDGGRSWKNHNDGPIQNWDDFEQYPWPQDLSEANRMVRHIVNFMPDGMKAMIIPGGIFEITTELMGLVPFSYALVDSPELVDAVISKTSELIHRVIEELMEIDGVGGIFMGDDMGFASGTLVSPKILREKFFPHLKQYVELTHSAGKIFCLHTCGDIYAVMDDFIEMGIDAKHSFEDKIMPVEAVHAKWGEKIALIGGVDVDLLTTGPEEKIRKRTREILDACASKGRYILGTGNSVAGYIPIPHYIAMIEEARKWNLEHFGREW